MPSHLGQDLVQRGDSSTVVEVDEGGRCEEARGWPRRLVGAHGLMVKPRLDGEDAVIQEQHLLLKLTELRNNVPDALREPGKIQPGSPEPAWLSQAGALLKKLGPPNTVWTRDFEEEQRGREAALKGFERQPTLTIIGVGGSGPHSRCHGRLATQVCDARATIRMLGGLQSLLSVVILLAPALAPAQEVPPACSFAACALRLERGGIFSGSKVLRGADGEFVGDYEPSTVLQDLFAAGDSTAAYYAEFTVAHRSAKRRSMIGLALSTVGLGVLFISGDTTWGPVLHIGGLVVEVTSAGPRAGAQRAFSRAVWWYNRGLAGG